MLVPAPPLTESAAVRLVAVAKMMRSASVPPVIVSSPAAAVMVLLPALPVSTSLPAEPVRSSAPEPPINEPAPARVAVKAPVKEVPSILVATAIPAKVIALAPFTLTVVAAPAVKLTEFAAAPLEVTLIVSTPLIVMTPAFVTLVNDRLTESVRPATAAVVYAKVVPTAVLLIDSAGAVLLMALKVKTPPVVAVFFSVV